MRLLLFLISMSCIGLPAFSQTTISGYVKAKDSEMPISGVSVYWSSDSTSGTQSNAEGYYSLPFNRNKKQLTLHFSAIGFQSKEYNIDVEKPQQPDIFLTPDVQMLDEVAVRSRSDEDNLRQLETAIRLDVKNLNKLPVVFGESDVIKALMLQAGISNAGEGSAGFNVRGGRTDQNLILLDGMPIYNSSHLLGFFSNFNTQYLSTAKLYKSNLPIAEGGRISSLLNLQSSHAIPDRKTKTSVAVGLISSRAKVDYKLNKKMALTAAARIGYPNIFIKKAKSRFDQARAAFYDINGKWIYTPDKHSVLSASLYHSFDNFKFSKDTLYQYQTKAYAINYENQISNRLSVSALLSYSHYQFNMYGYSTQRAFDLTQKLIQKDAKVALHYKPNAFFGLELGAYLSQIANSPGDLSPSNDHSNVNRFKGIEEEGKENGLFAGLHTAESKKIAVQIGLRYSFFNTFFQGQRFTYAENAIPEEQSILDTLEYNHSTKISNYQTLEPRATVKFKLSENQSLKFNYGKPVQYIHQMSNTQAISPVDFWKLSDEFVAPQRASLYTLGYFSSIPSLALQASCELYYKDIHAVPEYKNGARLLLNNHLETELLAAKGKTYGFEIELHKASGLTTGMISYTFSRSFIRTPLGNSANTVNEGRWFPSNFDKPHMLNLTLNRKLGDGWSSSLNFVYRSGTPTTFPDGIYLVKGLPVPNYSQRNLNRIPDYHRMDIGLIKEGKRASFVFSVYNLYGRKNPYSIFYSKQNLITRWYKLSVFGAAIPSISYQITL
ncbi:TonB-dependent receptor [Marinilongibacter aquaticus]|uniref:TonB-dependent receptor n=1 Tax=Marinilongibacter aquaticus TaxID=2975157 RepID=UPI0021BD4C3C|nr:TonB-dependent receptor [Marinilongibacter aquaticus]UBM60498.1 TonB-dependent receptor [Marinilongibacter aquaticus]